MTPRFPGLARGYESFYVRAVDPERPRGLWLRHTVTVPGQGSVWVTLFDRERAGPVAHKVSVPAARPADWIAIGESRFGPHGVRGTAGAASYDLAFEPADEPPLRHLPHEVLYRAPLPRTKLESPLPAVRVRGRVAVGDVGLDVAGWPGMVGHNWGAEHAERWIWLHGTAFEDAPDAWLDVAIGRVRLGPVTTPWIANGAVSAGGRRIALRGLAKVREDPLGVDVELRGLRLTARSPREHTVVWRYGDHHHVANCSIAALEAHLDGGTRLRTAHGGVYELGMREATHGLPVQPFSDP